MEEVGVVREGLEGVVVDLLVVEAALVVPVAGFLALLAVADTAVVGFSPSSVAAAAAAFLRDLPVFDEEEEEEAAPAPAVVAAAVVVEDVVVDVFAFVAALRFVVAGLFFSVAAAVVADAS